MIELKILEFCDLLDALKTAGVIQFTDYAESYLSDELQGFH